MSEWGGKRAGAGRKKLQPTVTVRIPAAKKEEVMAWVKAPRTDKFDIYAFAAEPAKTTFPMMGYSVRAGFPSPADDHVEKRIDLNEELIVHREATFFLRVRGKSMLEAGIDDGDELIVDRAIHAEHGRIVVAAVDGELTVKRLYRRDGVVKLMAQSEGYPDIELQSEQELVIWGVVTRVIKKV